MPTEPQITHYEGCWREHHGCALGEIERLTAERDGLGMELGRVASERDEARAERDTARECHAAAEDSRENLARYAADDFYYSLPMSGPDILTRNALRDARSERDAARSQLAEVEGRLPKTADGVVVVPGMKFYYPHSGVEPSVLAVWFDGTLDLQSHDENGLPVNQWKRLCAKDWHDAYSTPEAAAAAREAAK